MTKQLTNCTRKGWVTAVRAHHIDKKLKSPLIVSLMKLSNLKFSKENYNLLQQLVIGIQDQII